MSKFLPKHVFILWLLLVVTVFSVRGLAAPKEDELPYLRAVLPDPLLEYAHMELASPTSAAVKGDEPKKYLGLHLYPGQEKVFGGMRAEVGVNNPFEQGDTIRYSWRFMLPKDFVLDAPANRWWIIGQWHDQPNRKVGEVWGKFGSHNPPIALTLSEVEGKPALSLIYGSKTEDREARTLGPIFLERGKWHELAVVIHWSMGPEGTTAVFLDDPVKPALTAEGPNMNNDYQHFWKLGLYRDPEIATDNWIYVADLNLSKVPKP